MLLLLLYLLQQEHYGSVGETTDVVQKEMYTVKAKESEFTLRPEGTAGTIRAMLQNGS